MRTRTPVVWPAMCIVLLAALAAALLLREGPAAEVVAAPEPVRVGAMRQVTDTPGLKESPTLAPDGRTLAYSARDGADRDIYMMRVGGENALNLTPDSSHDDFDPAFSPDGERIAFASSREGGDIFVMGATGENPRRVADEGFDPAWSPDGTRLVFTSENVVDPYGRSTDAYLTVVDLESRATRRLETGTTPSTSVSDAVGPAWSPDGEWIAFWAVTGGQRDIFVVPAAGGQRIALTNDAPTDWNLMWSADGRRLFFISDRLSRANLWSIPFDPATGGPDGAPVAVTLGPAWSQDAAMSRDGRRIVFASRLSRDRISRVGFDSAAETITGPPRVFYSTSSLIEQPSATPDGRFLVYRSGAPEEDIYIMNGDGSGRRRLTNDPFRNRGPRISSDGRTITFYSNRGGSYEIWQMQADGTGLKMIASRESRSLNVHAWSPDGRTLAANSPSSGGSEAVFFERSASEELEMRPEIIPGFALQRFSPDGSRMLGSRVDGTFAAAVCDLESGSITPLMAPDGDTFLRGGTVFVGDWLDDDRIIGGDLYFKKLFLADARTGVSRFLDADVPGDATVIVVRGGAELILISSEIDSDIWMIDLENQHAPEQD